MTGGVAADAARVAAPAPIPFRTRVPFRASTIDLPPDARPALFVVVDTEEEFDWTVPFSRGATRVTAIRHVRRLQAIARAYEIVPTYVIDYPVARAPAAAGLLAELARAGDCQIGAHLHPWVTPPFDEPICARSSYGCNLPPLLEAAKIRALKDTIAERLDVDTVVYKAGRYGFGASTATNLESLGFDVDLSVNPHMDFSRDGGPSFAAFDARPFRFGSGRTLFGIPCTTGFTGLAGTAGARVHAIASSDAGLRVHLPGVLARLGVVNKIMLSPEGFTFAEMRALTERLYRRGVRTFSLTLHSPSLAPGNTPYARTARDVEDLLGTVERFFDFFFVPFGGVAATPLGFLRNLRAAQADKSPAAH